VNESGEVIKSEELLNRIKTGKIIGLVCGECNIITLFATEKMENKEFRCQSCKAVLVRERDEVK